MPDHIAPRSLAIACSTGGFKGVFVHGVLSALEAAGMYAAAYAAASSSVFPSICAAIRRSNEIGLRYWRGALQTLKQPGKGMSEVVLQSIADSGHLLRDELFQPGVPRFCIAASAVVTAEGEEQAQGAGARRLGRRLLLAAARGDRSWANEHLRGDLFDTAALTPAYRLNADTIAEVVYASTRMLHTWTIPAWIAGKPYIDASYTCACPALEVARLGYREVIAIASEPGVLYRDIFQGEPVPDTWNGTAIHIIRPEIDPAKLGAAFTSVSEEGLVAAYMHGEEQGRAFLANWR